VRLFVAALAQRGPVALVFEDLHWGDALSLDLIGELMEEEEDLLDEADDISSSAADSLDIWAALGVPEPAAVPMLEPAPFLAMAASRRERADA